jgi:hypothetical protein
MFRNLLFKLDYIVIQNSNRVSAGINCEESITFLKINLFMSFLFGVYTVRLVTSNLRIKNGVRIGVKILVDFSSA